MKRVQRSRQQKTRAAKRRRPRARGVSAVFLATAVIVVLGITLVFNLKTHTQIAELNTAIAKQHASLEEMDKTYRDLNAGLDAIKSSEDILRKAKFQLGMVYPDNDQVKYIDVNMKNEKNDVNENVYLNPVISVLHIFKED